MDTLAALTRALSLSPCGTIVELSRRCRFVVKGGLAGRLVLAHVARYGIHFDVHKLTPELGLNDVDVELVLESTPSNPWRLSDALALLRCAHLALLLLCKHLNGLLASERSAPSSRLASLLASLSGFNSSVSQGLLSVNQDWRLRDLGDLARLSTWIDSDGYACDPMDMLEQLQVITGDTAERWNFLRDLGVFYTTYNETLQLISPGLSNAFALSRVLRSAGAWLHSHALLPLRIECLDVSTDTLSTAILPVGGEPLRPLGRPLFEGGIYAGVVVGGIDELYRAQRKMLFLEPAYDPSEAAGRWVPRQLCRYALWAVLGDVLHIAKVRETNLDWYLAVEAVCSAWAGDGFASGIDGALPYLAQVANDLDRVDSASASSYLSTLQGQVGLVLSILRNAYVRRPLDVVMSLEFPTCADLVCLSSETAYEQSTLDLSWRRLDDSPSLSLPECVDDADYS
jgi:hypothetical protein